MYNQFNLKNWRKKGKFNNVTKQYNGRSYDSKLEAKVAQDLDFRVKSGEVKEVIPQFKIPLNVNGVHIANYFVDFKVIKADGSVEFVEAKGLEMPLWKMKWRLLEALLEEIEPGAELIVVK